MKKAIATLLSFCMMFSILAQGPVAYAQEAFSAHAEQAYAAASPETGAMTEEEEIPDTLSQESEVQAAAATVETAAPVLLDVDTPGNISAVEVTLQDPEELFTVQLLSASGERLNFEKAASKDGLITLRAANLPNGDYTLTVTGERFATYTQHLTLQDRVYALQLYKGFLAGYTYETGSVHPGVLRLGDVTGDGIIDQRDAQAVIDAFGTAAPQARHDLNGDGAVDLTDLQIIAANINEPRELTAAVSTSIPAAAAAPATAEGTTAEFKDEAVKLKTETVISEDNPAVINFDFAAQGGESGVAMEAISLQTPTQSENAVTAATITVEYVEDGQTKTKEFAVETAKARAAGVAVIQPDGSVVIDFGKQIAVKKVSIKVTATADNTNLAEITKVEFLNDMESRIPAPTMDIPGNLLAEPANRSFTLTWDAAVNVTGYEVLITLGDKQQAMRTTVNQLTVTRFDGEKLENGTEYTVKVQSVNGEWSSGYGEAVKVVPKVDELPPAPDGLRLTGRFQRIEASWDKMKDTDTYNLYYRKANDTGAEFTKIEGIAANGYTIQGLQNNVTYEVYVTGVNDLGEGPASLTAKAATTGITPVKMPLYKLINTLGDPGQPTAHITSIIHETGYMKDSPLDSGNSAWGAVDNDFGSWYGLNDWDDGAAYPDNGGIRVTFDQAYHIGSISLTQAEERGYYGKVRVYARNDGGEYLVPGVSIVKHADENGHGYYTIKIPGGVTTDYLRVCVGYLYWNSPVSIAEMRFYRYDSLEDDILALYADDLHLALREGVNEQTIADLQTRLDTPDEASGQLHPDRVNLQRELDNARGLLDANLQTAVQIHTGITAQKDSHLGFTGLNAWQPLGVTAYANEELVLYVGSNSGATGANASLQLIFSQYNAEYGQVVSKAYPLQIGRNEVLVPDLVSFDAEHGGALYVQYTGNNAADQYSVRVSGGTAIPVLDLYGIDDAGERLARVTAYVQQLEARAAELETLHNELHSGSGLSAVDHAYNPEECILNTTDILLDQMMLSVPATQVLAGLDSGSTADKAARLLNSMDAMDQMMVLFYQHKGLTNLEGAGDRNRLPAQHLNIRYMRMFAGAFMYAAGNHIGIGWDSVLGLAQGNPVVLNEAGNYLSGEYFGWGIAHEIGHNINQGSYAVAEVTNNYFSQISQAREGVRFGYEAIYRKVTSGALGAADDVFTQLGMYWQLHLAYDRGYEYQIYDSYGQLFESRFFARVDTYARTPSAAPAPGGLQLSLGGDANQNLMRLASAAAQRDLTEFFGRWGLVPDTTTAAYMAQFEPEPRAIYYTNDTARDYAFTHGDAASFAGQAVLTGGTTAVVDGKTPNQVNLTLAADADSELVLGYEISRITWQNGKATTQVVGFTTNNTYTDTITTVNNRTVAYQVTAVDKFLNRSQSMTLPAVKISHDGSYEKSLWTVTTNMVSDQDTTHEAVEKDPCAPQPVSAISRIIDNNKNTTYTGRATSGKATITVDFHKTLAATGFKYTVTEGTPIQSYEVQISTDGTWKTLATGTFTGDEVNTVYFRNENNDPWVCTYDADQLRLIVTAPTGTNISISELDVLGPTGDNVELLVDGIGTLQDAYIFDADAGEAGVIPAGSLLFTGSYKGNPAYNVVLLYDQNGSIVGGVDAEGNLVAHQIILAEVPEQGKLGEVSEGSWVYWIEPDALEGMKLPETVRAEIYRVDNATTNEGQRLTGDTLPVTLPGELPNITLTGDSAH